MASKCVLFAICLRNTLTSYVDKYTPKKSGSKTTPGKTTSTATSKHKSKAGRCYSLTVFVPKCAGPSPIRKTVKPVSLLRVCLVPPCDDGEVLADQSPSGCTRTYLLSSNINVDLCIMVRRGFLARLPLAQGAFSSTRRTTSPTTVSSCRASWWLVFSVRRSQGVEASSACRYKETER